MEVRLDYVVIEQFNLYKYREVYKILEMENGSVKRAETTGKYIEVGTTIPEGYLHTSVSTSVLKAARDKPIRLDIFH